MQATSVMLNLAASVDIGHFHLTSLTRQTLPLCYPFAFSALSVLCPEFNSTQPPSHSIRILHSTAIDAQTQTQLD
jgi:hypothetical protein